MVEWSHISFDRQSGRAFVQEWEYQNILVFGLAVENQLDITAHGDEAVGTVSISNTLPVRGGRLETVHSHQGGQRRQIGIVPISEGDIVPTRGDDRVGCGDEVFQQVAFQGVHTTVAQR